MNDACHTRLGIIPVVTAVRNFPDYQSKDIDFDIRTWGLIILVVDSGLAVF